MQHFLNLFLVLVSTLLAAASNWQKAMFEPSRLLDLSRNLEATVPDDPTSYHQLTFSPLYKQKTSPPHLSRFKYAKLIWFNVTYLNIWSKVAMGFFIVKISSLGKRLVGEMMQCLTNILGIMQSYILMLYFNTYILKN